MYKLNDISNEDKDNINLYNLNLIPSVKMMNQKKGKRNFIDLTITPKKSKNYRTKYIINENSLSNTNSNNNKRIKYFVQKKENNFNKTRHNNSNSFKGNNIEIYRSFMINDKNFINSINKKFKAKNFMNFIGYKTVSDINSSSWINNNSIFQKNEKKNIFNLKLGNNNRTRNIKKVMSTINISKNNKKKKNFFEQNNSLNYPVNIKNYNYFIGTIDKSVNIYNQPQILQNKEKIQKLKKIENLSNKQLDEMTKPKNNYINLLQNTNLKLNLPQNKLRKIGTKKVNNNLNISADNDINNKETSINETKNSLKIKTSSKLIIPKQILDNSNTINKPEKKEEKNIQKKIEKTTIEALSHPKKEIENDFSKNTQKNTEIKILSSNKEGNNEEKGKEKEENIDIPKSRRKKNSKKRSSILEKNIQKRVSYFKKKLEQKNKIKFLNLTNHKKILEEEKNKFLSKIVEANDISEKSKDKKLVKDSKYGIIIHEKIFIDSMISEENEKLKYINFNYSSSQFDKLNLKTNILLNEEKLIEYESTISKLQINDFLEPFKYSIISFINKCALDINLKTYLFSNLNFSSLDLVKVDQDDTLKQSLLLSKISHKRRKEEDIFSINKKKFIESRRYKYNQITQVFSSKLIKKELDFYNILKSINFLEQENNINDNDKSKGNILTLSPSFKTGIFKRKKSNNFSSKRLKFPSRKNTKYITHQQNDLSVLENRKFYSQEKNFFMKKFRNSMSGNFLWYKVISRAGFKKILTKGFAKKDISDVSLQKEYQYMDKVIKLINARKLSKEMPYNKYELLQLIKDKQNIESILRLFILRGETMLFIDYFNDVYKKIDINSRDGEGNTFLILSVKSGMNYISKILLEKGADVNIQNYEGNAALHFALSRKNFQLADLLKIHGAKEDLINKKGYNPWECLGKSIESGD